MNNDDMTQARRQASTLAANLVLAREAAGLTQTELAERAGTSRATIAQIESGQGDPRLSTLGGIADALGVSVIVLLLSAHDLQRLTDLSVQREQLSPSRLDQAEHARLKQLSESRVTADRKKAAQLSSVVAKGLGFVSPGAAVGAAIGTALSPGMGTLVGAFMGSNRRSSKTDEREED